MKKNSVDIECSSPEELAQELSGLVIPGAKQERFVAVTIHGPHILARQFELPRLSARELTNALQLEAVELLHIPVEDVELTYQVFSTTEDKIEGIFVAAPKSLITEYLACCDLAGVIPVKMTACIITTLEAFLRKESIPDTGICLLDFRHSNRVNLAVFDGKTCVLLREIVYENQEEAEREVIDSLRYSHAKSSLKQLSAIYMYGQAPEIDGLTARLVKEFDITAQHSDSAGTSSSAARDVLTLNLLARYAVTLPVRNRILQIELAAMSLCLLICVLLAVNVVTQHAALKAMRASFQMKDYEYAKLLTERIKALENAE